MKIIKKITGLFEDVYYSIAYISASNFRKKYCSKGGKDFLFANWNYPGEKPEDPEKEEK